MVKGRVSIAGSRSGRPGARPGDWAPWRREARETFELAWPLILTSLATIAISTTDVVMMGWLGPTALAAGSLGHHLYFPLYLLGLGVVMAVSPIMAQEMGAGEVRGIRRSLRQGLWVSLMLGLPLGAVLWQAESLLALLGQDSELSLLAQGYLRAALWGLAPAFGFVVMRGFFTAHSRPRPVLVVTLMGVAVNALGNYALMFGHFGFPRLELVGAGISSAVVHIFMFLVALAYAVQDQRFRSYELLVRFWRPDWPRFFEIWRLGLPIGLGIIAGSMFFSGSAFLMGLLGKSELAAHAIALQAVAVSFMVPLGISQATMVRVGLHAGARDPERVGRAGWSAFAIGMGFMILTALAFLLGGRIIVGLFLDLSVPANAEVGSLAVALLLIAAVFQFADGGQVIIAGALRGLKDTRVPMYLSFLGFLPLGLTASWLLAFPLDLGSLGVWGGMVVGLYSVMALMIWRFRLRARFWSARLP